ncbi:MAG: N-acetylmuramoyl-L-alanine amidase [Beijerinckiaceae bacterium]
MGRFVARSLLTAALVGIACTAAWGGPQRRVAQATATLARPDAPVAYEAELKAGESTTTLTIHLSRSAAASAFVLERPDRVVVDLPVVNFQIGDDAGRKGAGLVRSFRYGLFTPGRSRLVIDLTQPSTVEVENAPGTQDGHVRLTVKLSKIDRAAFARSAQEGRSAAPPTPQHALPASDSRPLVVIDPGHGGIDPGARARNGQLEKNLVFDMALALKEKLAATGRYRVLMTRDDDVFVALADRVKFARRAQADLLISLHADALASHDGVRGASIYTGSEKASDAYAARLAESENKADAAAGADAGNEILDDVNDILADLTRRETRTFAHRFAKTLAGDLGSAVPMHKSPLRSAGFRVLMAPDVPSVLVELGYLTNTNDIALLTSDAGRAKASAAIVAAVDGYFARRGLP